MTAKPGQKDLEVVEHHLYDIIDMNTTSDFNVQKYQEIALDKIQEIISKGKVPIVVGGTNYYIEALLFENSQKGDDDFFPQLNTQNCQQDV